MNVAICDLLWQANYMGIFETYSKRKKRKENTGRPDVYRYDDLPKELRVQIVHIWKDAIGPYVQPDPYGFNTPRCNNEAWEGIFQIMCRELGQFNLSGNGDDPWIQCKNFLLDAPVDHALDLIELTFGYVAATISKIKHYERPYKGIEQDPDDAIQELNDRFREHSVGYQFSGKEIIRVDSEYLHDQVIKPALSLLQSEEFSGADEEFRKAHEHYRHKRFKEALGEALKSFESTLKTICDRKSWKYPPNATSKALIELAFKNDLLPAELQAQFTALRSTLETGIPTVRNSKAGHGQGAQPIEVPEYLVGYALHITASAIVFLVEAAKHKD